MTLSSRLAAAERLAAERDDRLNDAIEAEIDRILRLRPDVGREMVERVAREMRAMSDGELLAVIEGDSR